MKYAFKFLPIVFGLFLGWMIFNPPLFLEGLGAMRWVVNFGLVAVLLVSMTPVLVYASLPKSLDLKPLPESTIDGELAMLRQQMLGLGFEQAGPPAEVQMAPAATLVGFAHTQYPVYATIFRTGTIPAMVSYDFISVLHGERGALTTNNKPEGAALPGGDGGLRQVLPNENLAALFRAHLDGIEYLGGRGISMRNVSASNFRQDFIWAMGKQREIFFSAPVTNSLVTFWRAATKRVPQIGRLVDQPFAQNQIGRLLAS